MGLFYASGRLVYNFGFEDFTSTRVLQLWLTTHGYQSRNYGPWKLPAITAHESCLQLRLMKVARNNGLSRHGIIVQIPISQSAKSRLVEVSSHFLARNLSQSRLADISPILHPVPIAGNEAAWPLQQGIRIQRSPFSCLSSSTHLVDPSHHSLLASFTHRIVCTTIFSLPPSPYVQ